MNSARSVSTSAANEAANFALSRNRKPSCGGKIGGTGAPGGGSLISDDTDSPSSKAIHEATVDENYGLNNRFRYCGHNVFLSCVFVCLAELSNLDHLFARENSRQADGDMD